MRRLALTLAVILLAAFCAHVVTAQPPKRVQRAPAAVVPRPTAAPRPTTAPSTDMYMTLVARGEPVVGDVTRPGHEQKIRVFGFSHELLSPTATAPRQIGPLVIRKRLDQSTPFILAAWSGGDRVDRMCLELLGPDAPRPDGVSFTIELERAAIIKLRHYSGNMATGDATGTDRIEELSFSYEALRMTHEATGVEHWADYAAMDGA